MTASLDQANKLLQQLRSDFISELPEKLEQFESLVLALTDSEEFHETYETLFRSIHSLKGSAGTHGLSIITFICHQCEDYLTEIGRVNHATEDNIGLLLEYLDLIRRALELDEQQANNFSEIDRTLDSIRQRTKKGKVSALIIEDKTYLQEILKSTLAETSLEYSINTDGLSALSLLLRIKYDILISSAEAKSLNGTALLYALRASGSINRNIKTIILTSRENPEFVAGLAPDHIIQKDKHLPDHLKAAINHILSPGHG